MITRVRQQSMLEKQSNSFGKLAAIVTSGSSVKTA